MCWEKASERVKRDATSVRDQSRRLIQTDLPASSERVVRRARIGAMISSRRFTPALRAAAGESYSNSYSTISPLPQSTAYHAQRDVRYAGLTSTVKCTSTSSPRYRSRFSTRLGSIKLATRLERSGSVCERDQDRLAAAARQRCLPEIWGECIPLSQACSHWRAAKEQSGSLSYSPPNGRSTDGASETSTPGSFWSARPQLLAVLQSYPRACPIQDAEFQGMYDRSSSCASISGEIGTSNSVPSGLITSTPSEARNVASWR